MTTEQNPPTNKTTYRVSAAGIQVYANSTAEVVSLVHELALKFGKILPIQPNRPMHTEGIIPRSDGALVCLEYRFAATAEHLEKRPATIPCRYCGRPISPVGGRWSETPLVQKHLSGPLAYEERKMEIPLLAYQQLMRGGCVPPVSPGQASAPIAPAKQEPAPAPTPKKQPKAVVKPQPPIVAPKEEPAETGALEIKPGWAEVKYIPPPEAKPPRSAMVPQAPRPIASAPPPPQPTTDLKSAVAPAAPAGRGSGIRLVKTPNQPISTEAARFHRMRSDLGVPASAVAQEACLMLAEMQGLESGEIAPEEGKTGPFWAELIQAMQRAARKEAARETGTRGGGSPASKSTPRTTVTFF